LHAPCKQSFPGRQRSAPLEDEHVALMRQHGAVRVCEAPDELVRLVDRREQSLGSDLLESAMAAGNMPITPNLAIRPA
jgi:hypothetical protein